MNVLKFLVLNKYRLVFAITIIVSFTIFASVFIFKNSYWHTKWHWIICIIASLVNFVLMFGFKDDEILKGK